MKTDTEFLKSGNTMMDFLKATYRHLMSQKVKSIFLLAFTLLLFGGFNTLSAQAQSTDFDDISSWFSTQFGNTWYGEEIQDLTEGTPQTVTLPNRYVGWQFEMLGETGSDPLAGDEYEFAPLSHAQGDHTANDGLIARQYLAGRDVARVRELRFRSDNEAFDLESMEIAYLIGDVNEGPGVSQQSAQAIWIKGYNNGSEVHSQEISGSVTMSGWQLTPGGPDGMIFNTVSPAGFTNIDEVRIEVVPFGGSNSSSNFTDYIALRDLQVSAPTLPVDPPSVTTAAPTSITSTSAMLGGNITDDGGDAVTGKGIVWGLSSNPTVNDDHVLNLGSGTDPFSDTVPLLPMGTTIHYRAWATNGEGTSYGSNESFTTLNTATASLQAPEGFRMLSAPVEASLADFLSPIWTQGASGADFVNGDPNVFIWDIGTGEWSAVTNLSTTNVTAGTGVLVYVFDKDDYEDPGSNVWPKTLSVTGSENATDASPAVNSSGEGFTLLGNPFASPIAFGDVTKVGLNGTIYVWDANDGTGDPDTGPNDPGAGSWKTWNGTIGNITDGILAPFQGFFVENVETPAGTPSVTFPEGAKTTGGAFLGKANENDAKIVRLELNGENMRNSMWMQFSETGSLDGRVYGDALKLEPLSSNFAQLATTKGEKLFDINHLPIADEEYTIPVHISATLGGSYTLTATDFELPGVLELTFNDHTNGTSVPVTSNFSYTLEISLAEKVNSELSPLERVKQGPVVAMADEGTPQYSITVSNSEAVGIGGPDELPQRVALNQNYPNPFNPSTVISYDLPESGDIQLDVFDITGKHVAMLVNGHVQAGSHRVTFNAGNLSSGIYIYRLQSGQTTLTRKFTLIK